MCSKKTSTLFKSLFPVLIPLLSMAQFTKEEKVQGYSATNELTTFIFDPGVYMVDEPSKVVVTGSFSGWSSDMNDSQRILKKSDNGLWLLQVTNKEYAAIPPSAEFKFRINTGKWLDPPKESS
ncbi:MAG: pullulanase, partial [Bacteroidota bacterium]